MDELKEWLEEIAAWKNRWEYLRKTFGKKLDKMTIGEIMDLDANTTGKTMAAWAMIQSAVDQDIKRSVIPWKYDVGIKQTCRCKNSDATAIHVCDNCGLPVKEEK